MQERLPTDATSMSSLRAVFILWAVSSRYWKVKRRIKPIDTLGVDPCLHFYVDIGRVAFGLACLRATAPTPVGSSCHLPQAFLLGNLSTAFLTTFFAAFAALVFRTAAFVRVFRHTRFASVAFFGAAVFALVVLMAVLPESRYQLSIRRQMRGMSATARCTEYHLPADTAPFASLFRRCDQVELADRAFFNLANVANSLKSSWCVGQRGACAVRRRGENTIAAVPDGDLPWVAS